QTLAIAAMAASSSQYAASQSAAADELPPAVFESSFAEYSDVDDESGDEKSAVHHDDAAQGPTSRSGARGGGGNGTKVSEEKKLHLASFAVEHADDYRRMSRAQFNHLLSQYCAADLDLAVKKPLDVIKRARLTLDDFETTRQRSTGAAMQVTALHQVLAKWREIEDSAVETSATQNQACKRAFDEERAVANEIRSDMMTTPTARRKHGPAGPATGLASVIKEAVKELRASNGIRQQRRQDEQDERRGREVRQLRLDAVEKTQSEMKRKLESMSEAQDWVQKKLRQQSQEMKEQTKLLREVVGERACASPAASSALTPMQRTTTERETYRFINEPQAFASQQGFSTSQYLR
ncbi:hypothetical protein KEM52_005202, partial [Ascosphaera acerosa]